jgi:hypothetical protein
MKTFAEVVDNYTPRQKYCSTEMWSEIAVSVRFAVKTAVEGGSPKVAVGYMTTLTALLVWMRSQGHIEVDMATALSGDVIESFVSTLPRNQGDLRSRLRRISKGNGFDPTPTNKNPFPRRDLQPPYSREELEALWTHAATKRNRDVRLAVQGAMVLSLGCGFRVRDMSNVEVSDVHRHGEVLHVSGGCRCVPVSSIPDVPAVEWLEQVMAERGSGLIIGAQQGMASIRNSSQWIKAAPGLPAFSIFRMRSTWMCSQLASGVGALELMALAGVESLDGIDSYRAFVEPFDASCSNHRGATSPSLNVGDDVQA